MIRRLPSMLALALAALIVAACGSSSSGPPRREVILSSEAVDERVGREAAADVTAGLGIVQEPQLVEYVNDLGQRLARHAPRGGFEYHFSIVDQDAPNAFALPGGYIYVSRGLLLLANSEDELANVLGHEIVHVASRHSAARQAMIRGLPGPIQYFAQGAIAGYSRNQEREADRLGQGLAGLAGFDPAAMATFMKQLEFTERLRLGSSRLPRFFDTHPATTERVASAGARARMVAWKRQGPAPTRADYLRRIEGLVVGMGAAEGVFQGERFIHPDLNFGLRFPDSWSTVNTHVAVAAVNPTHDAQIILEGQAPAKNPEAAASAFLAQPENRGVVVDSAGPLLIGDYDAYRIVGQAPTPYGWLPIGITWVVREDGGVFRFTLVSRPGAFDRNQSAYGAVVRSFRPLTPQVRNSVREHRLHIATAQAGEDLAAVSRRTENQWDLQTTAVYNGIFATDALKPGQLVKVAVTRLYTPDRPVR